MKGCALLLSGDATIPAFLQDERCREFLLALSKRVRCADEALLVERVLAKNQVVGSKPTIRLADSAFSFPKVI